MRYRLLLLPALLLALTAAVACSGGDEELVARDIVAKSLWPPGDSAHYKVTANDVDGKCDIAVTKQDSDLVMTQSCQSGDFTDRVTLNVDPSSLRPRKLQREINGPDGPVDCTATYDGGTLNVKWTFGTEERTGALQVPTASYDSWSDLFLWRTIQFSQGGEEKYTDVGSCTQQRADPKLAGVRLDITAKEQLEVPAGQYNAWRVEVHSEGHTQTAWYTDDDKHTLVKYDNGSQVFELESAQ